MKLHLTEEENAFREEMRTFFTTEIPQEIRDTIAAGHHVGKDGVVQTQQILNQAGLAVPNWPSSGAAGLDTAAAPHLARGDAARVRAAAAGVQRQHGRPGDRELRLPGAEGAFLPPTANLDIWWCQGFSEPNSGSDLASLSTKATRDGDDWILNGQKTWTTLGQYADWIFVLCRTDPEAERKQQGISFILCPMDAEGVTLRPIELIDGSVEVNEVFFEDVRVPATCSSARRTRAGATPSSCSATSASASPRSAPPSARSPRSRSTPRRPAGSTTRSSPPRSSARERAPRPRAHCPPVVANSADGKPHPASSVLKLKGTEIQQAVSELAVDLGGPLALASGAGDGEGDGSDIPEWARVSAPTYLNLRKASIYGGSNEIQRQIIAGTILGL
jgi:alkylation response protein AidB-like acyl-CoA dehydrogenase